MRLVSPNPRLIKMFDDEIRKIELRCDDDGVIM